MQRKIGMVTSFRYHFRDCLPSSIQFTSYIRGTIQTVDTKRFYRSQGRINEKSKQR